MEHPPPDPSAPDPLDVADEELRRAQDGDDQERLETLERLQRSLEEEIDQTDPT